MIWHLFLEIWAKLKTFHRLSRAFWFLKKKDQLPKLTTGCPAWNLNLGRNLVYLFKYHWPTLRKSILDAFFVQKEHSLMVIKDVTRLDIKLGWTNSGSMIFTLKFIYSEKAANFCEISAVVQGVSKWSGRNWMPLRDRRINIYLTFGCLGASGGVDFWVSSTCFQKSNIDWPQQPPTEKVLKFNMIFHDSTPKNFFIKHKNKAEFKCLDDSEVLNTDFPGLKTSSA